MELFRIDGTVIVQVHDDDSSGIMSTDIRPGKGHINCVSFVPNKVGCGAGVHNTNT